MDDPVGNTPVITVRLFGAFEVRRNGAVLTAADMGGCKPRHILEILLLHLGTPVSKARLAELLWGPTPANGAIATLESYVSGIRRAIQPGNTKTGPLRTANSGYVLDPQLVELDLSVFQQLVRAARQAAPAEAHMLAMQALEVASEPLLGFELVAEWAEAARTRHAAEKVAAQILAAETAAFLDRPERTISLAQQAILSEPLNERAWTLLISGYELAGLPAEGLSAYERCRRLFDRDLGCAPGPGLQAAHLRLLRQRAEESAELSEVLAALLCLDERLHGPKHPELAGEESRRLHENAGRVLDAFLQEALAAAV
ncbi:MAG: BTAD domain-containing putative transcriptional regulator [Arthrobacter sp.]